MISEQIKKDLRKAIEKTFRASDVQKFEIHLERPESSTHGDYSSSFALTNFKKILVQSPRLNTPLELAEKIAANFPKANYLEKVEAIPPGFINFHLSDEFLQKQVEQILKQKQNFDLDPKQKNKRKKLKIQVEFVSANPTGPLHVGNCRGGFSGKTLANILEKLGYQVQREYYINDRGLQIEKLSQSLKARYQQLQGKKIPIPDDGYPGEYLKQIAKKIKKQPKSFKEFALKEILKSIKKTIDRMEIKYDVWFSEDSLYQNSQAKKALEFMKKKKLIYEKEGAIWFKSTQFNDEKDRVLIKSNGQTTYLLSDIAYHFNKFEKRKFDKVILFWGADHHGYVPRFLGMIEAIGHKSKAKIELCQLLSLQRGKQKVRMSKRTGDYITIDNLLDEIGLDAAQFHFLTHSLNKNMVLDLKKAKEKSVKNPVYYVQYAHARICSILRKAAHQPTRKTDFGLLNQPAELNLIRRIIQLPEILKEVEKNHQLQALPMFSVKLADSFHKFYEECQVLNENQKLTQARLDLIKATKIILSQTLVLMGITAPEKM